MFEDLCQNCGRPCNETHDLRCNGRKVTLTWPQYQDLVKARNERDMFRLVLRDIANEQIKTTNGSARNKAHVALHGPPQIASGK